MTLEFILQSNKRKRNNKQQQQQQQEQQHHHQQQQQQLTTTVINFAKYLLFPLSTFNISSKRRNSKHSMGWLLSWTMESTS